jgi:hypothetical protein
MVFGFNSEITRDGTSYHVQSELRAAERLLDTQIFVGGRCVGRRAALLTGGEGLSEEDIREQLKEQHRQVLTAVRAGELERLLADSRPVLHWLGVQVRTQEQTMLVRLRVHPVPASILARLETAEGPRASVEAAAAPDGTVELEFPFDAAVFTATLFVQAKTAGGSIAQKFRLHRK